MGAKNPVYVNEHDLRYGSHRHSPWRSYSAPNPHMHHAWTARGTCSASNSYVLL